jgi:aminoglycoside phosphotransferase (APT) family kinase protein
MTESGVSGLVDKTRAMREGEELDVEQLSEYLDNFFADEQPLEITQFPGGHSNLTYLLRRGEGPHTRELVLRRPPFGSKVKSAHDMGREHRVLSRLSAVYPKAPHPLLFCEDEGVIGGKFYVMDRIRGIILRKEVPPELGLDPARCRRLSEVLIDALAELHALDYEAIGLGDFGKPHGYVERQVSGWTQRYEASKTDEIPSVTQVAAWLAAHQPPEQTGPRAAALIHNDFKFDNVILDPADPTRIIGVLDWEMAALGDPLMDLGTTLSYWVEAGDPAPIHALAFGPTARPGMMTRRELVDRYAAQSGRDVSHILFYLVFGLFKTSVVVQQIYYRYAQGLTKDPRFAGFIHAVRLLSDQASSFIARGSL